MQSATTAKPRTEILISGFGGQGVIRMGQILGLCAIKQGHRVTMLKSHGTETRGGYVRAQLVIAPEYVDSPVVDQWPKDLLDRGALVVASVTEIYGPDRTVAATSQRDTFAAELAEALSEGYTGI